MGLDITYYRQIKLEPDAKIDGDGYPEDYDAHFRVWVNDDFPGRSDDLKNGGIYSYAENESFGAGAYSRYNRFREWLAGLVGTTPDDCWDGTVGPETLLFDLINFSDCEGVIGPKTSAKLAKQMAEITPHGDDRDKALFHEFKTAFETAADNGCVVFH